MEKLLSPDYGLMVWTICSFLILVFILGKFAWKPLISALNERESGIKQAIDDAAQAKQTSERLKAQLEADLAKGQARAQEFLSQAQADAQKAREQILRQAQDEARKLAEQTRRQLDEDKAKISRELRQEVAGISIRAAEKLLRHQMNAQEQQQLLQQFFQDLDKEKA